MANPSSPKTATASPRARNLKRLALGLLVVAALAGGGIYLNTWLEKKNAPVPVTAVVERGDIEQTVTSLGKLKPKDYVDVGAQVSGQLKRVMVEVGARVNKGDLIAEIDATVMETKVRTGRANLDNLRAQLVQQQAEAELAKRQFERNQALLKERAISQETVEANQSALKVANARVESTRAQIRASEATVDGDAANLGYTNIHAPMAGTIVSQTSLQGQTVNATQQAPVIVRIANLDTMTVWAQVAEADIMKIQAGMPAYFTTLGNTESRWSGTVRQVMPTPETVNDVVLYNVLVDVDNSRGQLMSDMTVQVFFVLDQARDALLIPLNALQVVRQPPRGGAGRAAPGDGKTGDRVASKDGAAAASTDVGASAGQADSANASGRGPRRVPAAADTAAADAAAADTATGQAQEGSERPARARSTSQARARLYEVQVLTEEGVDTRRVRVGVSNRTTAAILSGLEEGEKVVLPITPAASRPTGAAPAAGNRRTPGGAMGPRL